MTVAVDIKCHLFKSKQERTFEVICKLVIGKPNTYAAGQLCFGCVFDPYVLNCDEWVHPSVHPCSG